MLPLQRAYHFVIKYKKYYTNYLLFGTGFCLLGYVFKDHNNEIIRLGFAGSIAQISTEFFFHPIDVINTNTKADLMTNLNAYQTTKRIWERDGFYGFWKGASATYYGALIGGMIYFSTYKYFKNIFSHEDKKDNSIFIYFLSSVLGEFLFLIVYYPFDLIRTRMQTRRAQYDYKGVLDGFRSILKGSFLNFSRYPKLYVGCIPNFILNILNQSIMISVLESMRDYFILKRKLSSVNELTTLEYNICSILAGVISGGITNVLEVITIHNQLQGSDFQFIQFMKAQGLRGISSGMMARITINTGHALILFYSVDVISKIYNVEL